MSIALSKSLINAVALELGNVYNGSNVPPSSETIEQAIKRGFLTLDHHLVWDRLDSVLKTTPPSSNLTELPLSLPAAQLLNEPFTGSCALLAFYDSGTRLLRVAVTGDSRAVLGRRDQQGTWKATALSVDQYGTNLDEVKRIQEQHPGEKQVLKNKRLLGSLEPTRAFGDMFYKWPDSTQQDIRSRYLNDGNLGKQLAPNVTPPYLTAEPVVTSIRIQPEKGDFVVIASDGLWDLLSNEEVVGLVGRWIAEQRGIGKGNVSHRWDGWFRQNVTRTAQDDPASQKRPQHTGACPICPDERFVLEDRNAATHLLRNALGGKFHDGEMIRAMLTLQSPLSRRYRDDLTIEVIFFGEVQKE
jgi:pyruvate dehydrogenase phosphatase